MHTNTLKNEITYLNVKGMFDWLNVSFSDNISEIFWENMLFH